MNGFISQITYRCAVLSDANSDGIPDTISSPSTTNNWSLDAVGNWNSTGSGSRTFNSQNQITSMPSGSTTPTYDNNGNTTRDEKNATYVYDAWNRMVQATVPPPGGGSPLYEYFKYEALGQRSCETLCGGTTTYSYYSANWQDVEDDVNAGPGSFNKSTQAHIAGRAL